MAEEGYYTKRFRLLENGRAGGLLTNKTMLSLEILSEELDKMHDQLPMETTKHALRATWRNFISELSEAGSTL